MSKTTQYLGHAVGVISLFVEKYFQLFTIHALINGYNPSCTYALKPIKSEKTHELVLTAFVEKLPNSIHKNASVGFEKTVMNAF